MNVSRLDEEGQLRHVEELSRAEAEVEQLQVGLGRSCFFFFFFFKWIKSVGKHRFLDVFPVFLISLGFFFPILVVNCFWKRNKKPEEEVFQRAFWRF